MSATGTGRIRGNDIGPYRWDGEVWLDRFDRPVDYNMPCGQCHLAPTSEGYDACLGFIPGVVQACCGHGVEAGYVLDEIGGEPRALPLEVELRRHERYMWAWDAYRCRCGVVLTDEANATQDVVLALWATHTAGVIT